MNLCTTCGEDFGSVESFDAHRVGNYPQRGPSEYEGSIEDWTPERGRRCLTVDEMERARPWHVRMGRRLITARHTTPPPIWRQHPRSSLWASVAASAFLDAHPLTKAQIGAQFALPRLLISLSERQKNM